MGGKKIKIGFLPFYIKLYDDIGTGARARGRLGTFYETLAPDSKNLDLRLYARNFAEFPPNFLRRSGTLNARALTVL